MREYQQRHNLKRLFYSKITILLLGILCILMLRTVMGLYDKYKKVSALEQNSAKEEESLKEKLASATARVESLHSDRGMEEYIRETYPVVKQGEGVIVVYEASTSPVVAVRKSVGVWESVKLFLVRIFTN